MWLNNIIQKMSKIRNFIKKYWVAKDFHIIYHIIKFVNEVDF